MNEESKELIAMGMKLIKMGCGKTDVCDDCPFHDLCVTYNPNTYIDYPENWELPRTVL